MQFPWTHCEELVLLFMELLSGYIVVLEVRDESHVGWLQLTIIFKPFQASLNIVKVVTDASPAIKNLLGEHNIVELFKLSKLIKTTFMIRDRKSVV